MCDHLFLIINSGIPTTHVFNIYTVVVVVGMWFTSDILFCKKKL